MRPPRRQGKIRNKNHTEPSETVTNKKVVPLLLGLILLLQRKRQAKIRAKTDTRTETFLKSPVIIATKRATIPVIKLSQKTSNNSGNLHIHW